MKKLFRGLFVVLVGVLVFTSFKVKALTPPVQTIDGASIRNKSGEEVKQGLRFYAKLDETVKENEHGFYVIFGESDIGELITALEFEPLEINGKKVHRVVVDGVNQDNEFRVVLTGIPGKGYLDNITVIPFVVVDEAEVYDHAVTRSIGEVALKAAAASEATGDVIPYLEENYKRVVFTNDGKILFTGNMIESNHFGLREVFIKDWNEMFGTNFVEYLDPTPFFNSAKIGAEAKDLSGSNIYKFFNNPELKEKWGWFLNYMLPYGNGITHGGRQIVAIQGDGTNNDYALYNADHLSYSIANFFNEEHKTGGYTAVDYTTGNKYATVATLNDKIYISLNKYEVFKIGEEIGVGHPGERDGYTFKQFEDGETIYNVGDDFTVLADDLLLTLVYEPIEYDVKFYDGETELVALADTYDITKELTLPEPTKEGYIFLSWHDNEDLLGDAILKIAVGEMGDKEFYAKWTLETEVAYIGEVGYMSITSAIAAASPGDTIVLVEGTHSIAFTVNKNNLTFVPEAGKEVIIEAKITVGANMVGLKFDGLKFTGNAQIHAPAKLDGFIFTNNEVYDLTLAAFAYAPATREDVTAFIQIYTYTGSNQTGDVTIEDNEFRNIEANIISIDRTTEGKEINIRNNLFHNFVTSAIRFDGGYNNGTYNITGNTFSHDTKGANKNVIAFRGYAPETGKLQIININENEFINVGNTSMGIDTVNGHPGSGVIVFSTFNDRPTEVYIKDNLFKGTARAIHFRNAGSKADLSADFTGNIFEDNDDYFLYQARPESHPAPEADFTGSIFKDANGEIITNLAILEAKIINNNTYDKPAQPTFDITYDFGEYGYVTELTKAQFFADFADDYIAFNDLDESTDVLGNFNGASYQKQTFGFFNDSVYGAKWGWFKEYIEELKVKTGYASDLGTEAVFRSNIHHFFLETPESGFPGNWLDPMDFSLPELANGFWSKTEYSQLTEVFSSEAVLFDGSTITSWNDDYEFEGWYSDVELTFKVTELPESLEDNLTLYAKWVAK